MSKNKKLVSVNPSGEQVVDFATRAIAAVAATIPFSYSPVAHLFAAGAFFTSQSIVKMGQEVEEFIKSEKVKREIERTVPHRKLYETFKFLHASDTVDEDLVTALRDLHILTFADDITAEQTAEIYMLLDTARKLSGPEILTILAAYKINKDLYPPERRKEILEPVGGNQNTNHAGAWARMIAKACGYSTPDYIEAQQKHLEELVLITPRNPNQHGLDGRGNDFSPNRKSRLTDSGFKLAEYIVRGQEMFDDLKINK